MKKIIDFSLRNKFAIWILTIMVVVAGLYAGLTMKQESIPNITIPAITVVTTYPGAAPDEIAEELTVPLEQRIQNLNGVELVTSSSMANASTLQIQFTFETDMDEATRQVESALAEVSLPEAANEPQVSRISLDAFPVLALSISDPEHSSEELTTMVEENILPELEGVEGLSDAQVSGQRQQKATMAFDEEKLAQYGLTEETIQQLIQGSNISFPLGLTNFDGEMKNLVIDGNVATVDDLKNLQIPAVPQAAAPAGASPGAGAGQVAGAPSDPTAAAGTTPPEAGVAAAAPGATLPVPTEIPTVALSELADIEVVSEVESISRTNGEESIGIQVVKAPEANTVEVVNAVKDLTADLAKEYDLTITSTFDQAEPIEQSVETMLSKALFGILFAVVIILVFLRSFKTTIISIISIPLSLLMAIFLLNQMDITLNIMTLGALTVAIGRVIDDSIVVIENIYRRMSLPGEKLRGKELIREATREMFIPIFSSTVVTIAVFLPLALVSGQIGELFLPFALAVVFALSASLLVAVTIVPMLAHSMYGKQLQNLATNKTNKHEEKPSKMANGYKGILQWTLNHKIITFGGAVVLLAASFFLVPIIGVSFLPEEEQKMVMATYSPEPGQTRDDVEQIALDAEKMVDAREGVTSYQYSLGGGNPMGAMGGGGDNSALFFIEYDSEFEDFADEGDKLVEELNSNTDSGEWGTMNFAATGSSGFELFVYGDNIEDIQSAIDDIQPIMEDNKGLEKVESSLSEAYDQYTLVADQETLGHAGLTSAQIGMALSSAGDPPVLTTVAHEGEEINVYIEVEKAEYGSIDDITDVELPTALGSTVSIGDVVTVEEGKSPDTINRRDGQMYASLSAEVLGNNAAEITTEIDGQVDDLDLASGVTIDHGGVTEQINESFTQLGLAMLAAIAIVYFVLVVTFGGALAPLAILFSLPFTVIGVLVALWISDEPLSVNALIGVLMLIGIVVTNAIVLVDRVIHKEKEGFTTREALLEAGSTRLRPILMTALATVGALIPLAIGAEGGGLISKGLGITVIGGLISSTLLTLVIVPIVYEVFAKFRKKQVN
ncbi:efflux RND transporter permease subunit [Planococcus sp. YIM B11945]|uniref:efflux RND transporter permease subunit n=1 Tax=Planococcus sp. YIM B11945 TaxID=3435410 RepID=UPI003D7C5D1C